MLYFKWVFVTTICISLSWVCQAQRRTRTNNWDVVDWQQQRPQGSQEWRGQSNTQQNRQNQANRPKSTTATSRPIQNGATVVRKNIPEQVFAPQTPQDNNKLSSRVDTSQIFSESDVSSVPVSKELVLAGESTSKLATSMLKTLYNIGGAPENIILSPLSLWVVLIMILESAAGRTASQLSSLLGLPDGDTTSAAAAYTALTTAIQGKSAGAELDINNFFIRNTDLQVKADLTKTLKEVYNSKDFPVNVKNLKNSIQDINQWVLRATKNRVNKVIEEGDFTNFQFILGNVAYFKGKWKFPFNITSTFNDEFKNENDEIITRLPMMIERLVLNYSYSGLLDSQVIEIPYADEKTSMIVILPKRRVPLKSVIERMSGKSLSQILPDLGLEEAELYLPRFTVKNDLNLNLVLFNLGLGDMLTENAANLPHLSPNGYVSRVVHKVSITNDEEGTVSSAVTAAEVSYKTSLVSFHANRPFIYIINDIKSRSILFIGTITDPRVV